MRNISQHASEDMRVILMANIKAHRGDYFKQAEKIGAFCQVRETIRKKQLPMWRMFPESRNLK